MIYPQLDILILNQIMSKRELTRKLDYEFNSIQYGKFGQLGLSFPIATADKPASANCISIYLCYS